MTLVRYQPWSMLNQMRQEMDRLFETRTNDENSNIATSDWVPAVDIKENDNGFEIHADIPGVDPEAIEIHMENGMLSIKGERESETIDEQQDYKRVERSRGTFYRRFSLPESADAGNIRANSKNGVLEIIIPKQEKSQPRKISVQG